MEIEGRCFCGRVRFILETPTDFAGHCHCESCRRATGAPMVSWTSVPNDRFRLRVGEEIIRHYASSETVTWQFCGNCGTTLFYRSTDTPEKIYATIASLESIDRPVDQHVSFEEKPDWFDLSPDLPRYRGKTEERLV